MQFNYGNHQELSGQAVHKPSSQAVHKLRGQGVHKLSGQVVHKLSIDPASIEYWSSIDLGYRSRVFNTWPQMPATHNPSKPPLFCRCRLLSPYIFLRDHSIYCWLWWAANLISWSTKGEYKILMGRGSGVNNVEVEGQKKKGDCKSFPRSHINGISCSRNGNTWLVEQTTEFIRT